MKAQGVLRQDAWAAVHLVHLDMFAGGDTHPRSNCGAIASGAHQLDLDPILLVASDIVKERRQIVHVQDEDIHAAIVVIVSKSRSAAGKTRSEEHTSELQSLRHLVCR